MITIEHDELGTFSGETLGDANKKLRAALRAAAKERKLRAARQEEAGRSAAAAGLNLHNLLGEIRLGEREAFPRGIRRVNPFERVSSCHARWESGGYVVSYETSGGRAEFNHWGFTPVFGVENGAGFCIAIVLQDSDRDDAVQICAVGAFENEIVMHPLSIAIKEVEAAFVED